MSQKSTITETVEMLGSKGVDGIDLEREFVCFLAKELTEQLKKDHVEVTASNGSIEALFKLAIDNGKIDVNNTAKGAEYAKQIAANLEFQLMLGLDGSDDNEAVTDMILGELTKELFGVSSVEKTVADDCLISADENESLVKSESAKAKKAEETKQKNEVGSEFLCFLREKLTDELKKDSVEVSASNGSIELLFKLAIDHGKFDVNNEAKGAEYAKQIAMNLQFQFMLGGSSENETVTDFTIGELTKELFGGPSAENTVTDDYPILADELESPVKSESVKAWKEGKSEEQLYDEAVVAIATPDYAKGVEMMRNLAESGYAEAQLQMGRMYEQGNCVQKDAEKAVEWYRKSAEQGNASAQFNLGMMYYNGCGVSQDDEKAAEWYQKSAEQGNASAQFNLGMMYYNGRGVPQDNRKAAEWLQKSAEQGDVEAQFNLGVMYKKGHVEAQFNLGVMHKKGQVGGRRSLFSGNLPNDEKAMEWFQKAAEQGHAEAQFNLGRLYAHSYIENQNDVGSLLGFFFSSRVPLDFEKAAEWLRKSAEQGHAEAQHYLGRMYIDGCGVPQDDKKSVEWLRKSAEQGHAEAQRVLGWIYYYGRGVSKDEEEAVKWYRKSAVQGNAEAQNYLGEAYYYGRGVPQDEEEAAKWYRKSAEQGNPKGQWNLGAMYEIGRGVPRNDEKAAEWYRKSAEQGNAEGQFLLGLMYSRGRGGTMSRKSTS